MAALGAIIVLISFVVFLWAAVGLFAPQRVKLTGRGQAVGLWAVSVACFTVGAVITPDSESRERTSQPVSAAEHEEELEFSATVDPETEPAIQVSGVTFKEVNDLFGARSSQTELQKDRQWEIYEGVCVEWRGELVSLDEAFFGGFAAQFRHLPDTFVSDVLMRAPRSAEDELLTWSIGTRYTYRARLDSYGGAILPISVSMGCD